ncbi:MAG: CAP domain-containing protein [Candidatus Eremiobacteraeota bacterium]|nr:CAP domain-containing protein [Candidatus Eremiobacteraeota bacterium]
MTAVLVASLGVVAPADTAAPSISVVDLDSGNPIEAASVRVVGAPAGGARIVALGQGAFNVDAPNGSLLAVDVSAPAYSSATVALEVPSGGSETRVRLTHIGPMLARWMKAVNDDRAEAGAAPLTLDESLIEAARAHASEMARHGYMSHYDLQGLLPLDRCAQAGGLLCAENLAWGQASALEAEAAFMAERSSCARTCPPSAGHYLNLISDADVIGLAVSQGPLRRGDGVSPTRPFYDQEFARRAGAVRAPDAPTRATVGSNVAVRFRLLDGHRAAFANWFHTTCPSAPLSLASLSENAPSEPNAGCSTTTPTQAGLRLSSDGRDPTLMTLRGTPTAPGIWYLGIADSTGFLAVSAVRVQ